MEDEKTFRGNHYRDAAEREAWLAQRSEVAIEPGLPIVDAHHHLSPEGHRRYEVSDFLAHLGAVNLVSSVFVECGANYSTEVDYSVGCDTAPGLHMQPVAETRYVVESVRGNSRAARQGVCAAIVGFVNLLLGEKSAGAILESHIQAGEGRFRGIRQSAAWDPAIGQFAWRTPPPGLLLDPRFQSGLRAVCALGLTFDAWLYFPQMHDLILLARLFPDLTIVVNHFGGIIGVGQYSDWPDESFRLWSRYIHELSRCHNVIMKMGGLGMPAAGSRFHFANVSPSSGELATAWKPYIDATVEAFGAQRCMFGSNVPVERQTADYTTLWNAYKIATRGYSSHERQAMFSGTASRVYKVPTDAGSFVDPDAAKNERR